MTKENTQTTLLEYESKPVVLSLEAYNILLAIKNQLVTKHKKSYTFSNAVVELKERANGTKVNFTKDEVNQIKNNLLNIKQ